MSLYLDVHISPEAHDWLRLLIDVTEKAISIVQSAIDADSQQKFSEAVKLYQNALDYFMLALKCTFSPPEIYFNELMHGHLRVQRRHPTLRSGYH